MSFASNASDSEDLIRRGILKVVANGFFVDMCSGAACVLSLTQLPKEHGWRRLKIEAAQMPCMSASSKGERSATWKYVVGEAGSEGSVASTLPTIIEQHSAIEVHFLSVDASGFEPQALIDINLLACGLGFS
jgi:hypothetical protein